MSLLHVSPVFCLRTGIEVRMPRKIIMDCDPGHDDMIALLLVLTNETFEVVGITTSAGNQTQEKTLLNTLKILSFLGKTDIPVAKGNKKPILRELFIADYVHGISGLDGADLGEPKFKERKEDAVTFLKNTLLQSEEKITLVVTGPMTNIGLLLSLYPEVKEKIECISFMGGACMGGNITPRAEFNIYVDPEAAKIVFQSGIPLLMSGLDVTYKAQMMPEDVERIRGIHNKTSEVVVPLLEFFAKSTTVPFLAGENHVEGLHMHDPCAVAILMDKSKFVTKSFFGDIELGGEYSRGSTIIDFDGVLRKSENVEAAFDVERKWLIKEITKAIEKLN